MQHRKNWIVPPTDLACVDNNSSAVDRRGTVAWDSEESPSYLLLTVGGSIKESRPGPTFGNYQANFLRKQLDAIGKDYEWMVRDEGHGFTQYENRVDMYRTMLAFLDRNIGAQRPASAGGP